MPPVDPNTLADERRHHAAARPISKRCSTCRCRSPRCSAAPRMDVGDLLKLGPGTVLELDRKVGEAIDIYVNNRLVARGEVVLVEDKLGVTMTEVIKAEQKLRKGANHATSHRRHAQGPAHHRDQDRDGPRRRRHPRRIDRPGAGRAALRQGRRPADGRGRGRHPRPRRASSSSSTSTCRSSPAASRTTPAPRSPRSTPAPRNTSRCRPIPS